MRHTNSKIMDKNQELKAKRESSKLGGGQARVDRQQTVWVPLWGVIKFRFNVFYDKEEHLGNREHIGAYLQMVVGFGKRL